MKDSDGSRKIDFETTEPPPLIPIDDSLDIIEEVDASHGTNLSSSNKNKAPTKLMDQRIQFLFDDPFKLHEMIQREKSRNRDSDVIGAANDTVTVISFQRLYHLYALRRILIRVVRHAQTVLVIEPHDFWRLTPITTDLRDLLLNETPTVLLEVFPFFNFAKHFFCDKLAFLARNVEFQCWEVVAFRPGLFSFQSVYKTCQNINPSALNRSSSHELHPNNADPTKIVPLHHSDDEDDSPINVEISSDDEQSVSSSNDSLSLPAHSSYPPKLSDPLLAPTSPASSESSIELSAHLYPDPNYSYSDLITLAIKNSPGCLSVSMICDFIRCVLFIDI